VSDSLPRRVGPADATAGKIVRPAVSRRRDAKASNERRRAALYLDAEGSPTDNPREAVRGEILEYDQNDRLSRRTWFLLDDVQIKWLPLSEAAFLLWVLVLLFGVWVVAALVLGLL
jgi:hypothetical protein